MMRAKMYISEVKSHGEPVTQESVSFQCVAGGKPYGPNGENEDNTFARYTPMGGAHMTINNPELVGKLKQGDTFYVDFTLVEK